MGRDVLYFGEMRRMILAENIYNAYRARKASGNWGEWANANPSMARVLAQIEMINDND